MSDSNHDDGTIQVLLDRLKNIRLPRALEMKDRVDAGGCLDDRDLAFLKQVFEDATHIRGLALRHPEMQKLIAQMIELYAHITATGLNNEQDKQS